MLQEKTDAGLLFLRYFEVRTGEVLQKDFIKQRVFSMQVIHLQGDLYFLSAAKRPSGSHV